MKQCNQNSILKPYPLLKDFKGKILLYVYSSKSFACYLKKGKIKLYNIILNVVY